MKCLGTPCSSSFQPEVVQCNNMGNDGLGGIQWRVSYPHVPRVSTDRAGNQCDTDLPKGLRLGKVEVSCEGWSGPGDKNVLQGACPTKFSQYALIISTERLRLISGSCGLEYNLHRTNPSLYDDGIKKPSSFGTLPPSKTFKRVTPPLTKAETLLNKAFYSIFLLFLVVIFYSLLRSCLLRYAPRFTPPRPPWTDWSGGGGHGGDGRGGGGGHGPGPGFNPGAPPPYTKTEPSSSPLARGGGGGGGVGGFWTGLAAGSAATYLATNRGGNQARERPVRRQRVDWDEGDQGVGPSTGGGGGGGMRRATGFGGTTTR